MKLYGLHPKARNGLSWKARTYFQMRENRRVAKRRLRKFARRINVWEGWI